MARLAPGSAAVSGRPPRRAPGSRPASRRAPCPTRARRPRGHVGPATTDENRRPQHLARRPRAGRSAAPPAQRAPHRPLLPRCWELRDNLTIYDAAYMELAEAMDATLLTGDRRLARAPGPSAHRDPPAAHASAQYRLLSARRSATAPPGRRADLADLRRPSTLGHADERKLHTRISMHLLVSPIVGSARQFSVMHSCQPRLTLKPTFSRQNPAQ